MEISRLVVTWGLVCSVVGVGTVGSASAQAEGQVGEACSTELSVAERQYRDGAFDEAIGLISECLDQNRVSSEQAVGAYRLLTLAHIKRDELSAARSAIINLLSTDPDYTPDPVEEPPVYVSLVSLVRRELHLGPSSVSIRRVQPLPPSSAVVDGEIVQSISLYNSQDQLQALEDSTKRLPKVGW